MYRRNKILTITMLLFAFSLFAVIKGSASENQQISDSQKCSAEIEGLKFCVEEPQIIANSGEPITIKLIWRNSSDIDRRIGRGFRGNSVTIVDEKGEKLIPVYVQRMQDLRKREEILGEDAITDEDRKEFERTFVAGSDRGVYAEANQTEKDAVQLTKIEFDYDLTKKGRYKVTIRRTIQSIESGKTIEFAINDVEIEVK